MTASDAPPTAIGAPIPWTWLARAMSLPGKALHVAIEIWHCVELAESNMLSISMSRMAKIGISRFAASRGLTALEKAGLVSVIRHVGQKPIVTVLVSLAEPKSEAP